MVEWRFARGWTDDELEERLDAAEELAKSFEGTEATMTPAHGWNHYASEAVIARAPPGPPRRGDAFERAWPLVESYAFSDPRVVEGHFDADAPLLGRRMLLEIRVFGIHLLGAVVVDAVRHEIGADQTVRGYRYDTLEGHVERGLEWFLLAKDHRTGDVTFRIEAAWLPGDVPGPLFRFGFRLLARRTQRAWHRLAHLRLRTMLATGLAPEAHHLVHEGPPLPVARVQSLAGPERPADLASELDEVVGARSEAP